MVRLIRNEVGTPAAPGLHNGESEVSCGAVVKTPALGLPSIIDYVAVSEYARYTIPKKFLLLADMSPVLTVAQYLMGISGLPVPWVLAMLQSRAAKLHSTQTG